MGNGVAKGVVVVVCARPCERKAKLKTTAHSLDDDLMHEKALENQCAISP